MFVEVMNINGRIVLRVEIDSEEPGEYTNMFGSIIGPVFPPCTAPKL